MLVSQRFICACGLFGLLKAVTLVSKSLELVSSETRLATTNLPWETQNSKDQKQSLRSRDDPSSYVLFTFDNRPMNANNTHWKLSSEWNFMYASEHGHRYVLYDSDADCMSSDGQYKLSPVWCKLRAMLQVQDDFPDSEYFLYVDSDAVVDRHNTNTSLMQVIDTLANTHNWDQENRPIIFNQDKRNYWCNLLQRKTNYTWCFNSGTIVWRRHERSTRVLTDWWKSASDDYNDTAYNPLGIKFRSKWPYDQQQQEKIAEQDNQTRITVFPTPNERLMWDKWAMQKENFCLSSHAPSLKCFISHYCALLSSKDVFVAEYTKYAREWKVAKGITPEKDLMIPRKVLRPQTHTLTTELE